MMTEDAIRETARRIAEQPIAPRITLMSPEGVKFWLWHVNTPPKEKARRFLLLARDARLSGNTRAFESYITCASFERSQATPRAPGPPPGDVVAWRAYNRRVAILFSRARGRKLSRVLREYK